MKQIPIVKSVRFFIILAALSLHLYTCIFVHMYLLNVVYPRMITQCVFIYARSNSTDYRRYNLVTAITKAGTSTMFKTDKSLLIWNLHYGDRTSLYYVLQRVLQIVFQVDKYVYFYKLYK